MRAYSISGIVAGVLALATLLFASGNSITPESGLAALKKQPSVSVAPIHPVIVVKGKSASFRMMFRVSPGFHINSHTPNSDAYAPTVLKIDPPTDILAGKITYPSGEDVTFAFLPGEKLNVYAGDFGISGVVSTTQTIAAGTYKIRGELKYQACDNAACFPPKSLPIAFNVKVQKSGKGHVRRNPGQSPNVHR